MHGAVRHDRDSVAQAGKPPDVRASRKRKVSPPKTEIRFVILLDRAKRTPLRGMGIGRGDRQRKIARSENSGAVRGSHTCRVDCGERIPQLHITACRHFNAPRAGADHLVTRAAVVIIGSIVDTYGISGLPVAPDPRPGAGGCGVRHRRDKKFAHQHRALAGMVLVERTQGDTAPEIGRAEIGAGGQTVTPRLRVDRKIPVDRLQRTEPEQRVAGVGILRQVCRVAFGNRGEAVAQRVVEDQVASGA